MHSFNRYSARWQFIYNRYIEIPIKSHCQSSWNRSCCHYQYMWWIKVFMPEPGSLSYSKPVLFIDNHQAEVCKLNIFFNQGMSTYQYIKRFIKKGFCY